MYLHIILYDTHTALTSFQFPSPSLRKYRRMQQRELYRESLFFYACMGSLIPFIVLQLSLLHIVKKLFSEEPIFFSRSLAHSIRMQRES